MVFEIEEGELPFGLAHGRGKEIAENLEKTNMKSNLAQFLALSSRTNVFLPGLSDF
jgi:hypothetical protein